MLGGSSVGRVRRLSRITLVHRYYEVGIFNTIELDLGVDVSTDADTWRADVFFIWRECVIFEDRHRDGERTFVGDDLECTKMIN